KELSQVFSQVFCRGVPLRGPLRQGFQADPLQLLRDGVLDLPGRTRVDRRDLLQNRRYGVASKRQPPRQQLIQDDAEAENVGAAVQGGARAARLPRAHEGGRPGGAGFLAIISLLRAKTEVGDDRLTRRVKKNIGRLDVAMNESAPVGVVQR